MNTTEYALSLKQPWATLLAHGRKTIEVRRWPTEYRGPLLIHAARNPDPRPEAWALVPPELRAEAAAFNGGFIGAGTLVDCRAYSTAEAFAADAAHHLNPTAWYAPPVLYGLTFTALSAGPFRRYRGWIRIFPVTPGHAP